MSPSLYSFLRICLDVKYFFSITQNYKKKINKLEKNKKNSLRTFHSIFRIVCCIESDSKCSLQLNNDNKFGRNHIQIILQMNASEILLFFLFR